MSTFLIVCLIGFACNITVFVSALIFLHKENKGIDIATVSLLLLTCCIPWLLYISYLVVLLR